MKRIILICICFLGVQTVVMAGRDKAIHIDQLPDKALTLINTYFSREKVSYARVDKELLDTSYGVVFTSGNKIEFDRKGNWTIIEYRNGIPEEIIPADIIKYIHEHYPGNKVTRAYYDKYGYEMKLNNSIEIKFDRRLKIRK